MRQKISRAAVLLLTALLLLTAVGCTEDEVLAADDPYIRSVSGHLNTLTLTVESLGEVLTEAAVDDPAWWADLEYDASILADAYEHARSLDAPSGAGILRSPYLAATRKVSEGAEHLLRFVGTRDMGHLEAAEPLLVEGGEQLIYVHEVLQSIAR